MGTNYYHHYDRCDHCGREERRHICKSMVSFQGYRPDPEWPDEPMAGPVVASWADWKVALRSGGEIWDEYGTRWDVEEFIAHVEATEPGQRRRQYDWMVDHHRLLVHEWLDEDGFSFTDAEFS